MYRSIRNVLKKSSVHQNSSKGTEKAIQNEVISDRQTDRPTNIVTYRVACTRLKRGKKERRMKEFVMYRHYRQYRQVPTSARPEKRKKGERKKNENVCNVY